MKNRQHLMSAAAGICVAFGSPALSEQTVVERRLAALSPCSHLSATRNIAGKPVTIGVDQFVAIELRKLDMELVGNHVSVTFEGFLSCKTSDDALLKGDAAIDLTATAAMDLETCTVRSMTADSIDFSGTFGPLVASGWNLAGQPVVEREVTKMLVETCEKFTAVR